MRKLFSALCIFLVLSGCKKAVQNAQQDLVIQAMTSGQWVVSSFTQNGSDITTNFTGYKFQYYSNYTVDAIKNGVVENTGTWNGDPSTMMITANFTNAISPIDLINGDWHIDDNSWTYVVASQASGSTIKRLRLEKL